MHWRRVEQPLHDCLETATRRLAASSDRGQSALLRVLSAKHHAPPSINWTFPPPKELHGVKQVLGRGRLKGRYQFDRPKAAAAYRQILRLADFLADSSIITICSRRDGRLLYGMTRLKAALDAQFQRMRWQCIWRFANGLVFFDDGHDEYRKLDRRAHRICPA